MDAGQLDAIVARLAEKIDVAADGLMPLASEVVRQYVAAQWLYATCAGVGAVLCLCVAASGFVWAYRTKADDLVGPAVVATTASVGMIVLFVASVQCAGHAIAPLPTLLGM